jgi:hypothetical protein
MDAAGSAAVTLVFGILLVTLGVTFEEGREFRAEKIFERVELSLSDRHPRVEFAFDRVDDPDPPVGFAVDREQTRRLITRLLPCRASPRPRPARFRTIGRHRAQMAGRNCSADPIAGTKSAVVAGDIGTIV